MVIIAGSQGEGGGQVLRTALGLALVTGQQFLSCPIHVTDAEGDACTVTIG